MPRPTKAKSFREWEALMKGVVENECDLAGVGPFWEALAKARSETLTLMSVRDALYASAEEANQQVKLAFAQGNEAALRLRLFVKSKLGLDSEKLPQFGMKLRRPPKPPVEA